MPILVGTHYHPASPEGLARQERARASLRELAGVRLVNLQFPDAIIEVEGFRTVPRLLQDSVSVSGRPGTRKPIGSEAFERLAECAREEGCTTFGWVNSDIIVTTPAISEVLRPGIDAAVFSRINFDGASGADIGMELGGLDAFFFTTAWWERHRHRFQPYINSEAYWDPVYAAIALCHGAERAVLLNRTGLIRHEAHPKVWNHSPFAEWNRRLAARDALYFEQWTRYRDHLVTMRAAGATEAEEVAWKREAFRWPPRVRSRVRQVGRLVKAWLRKGR